MVIIIYSISTKPRHHNNLMRPKSNPTVLQSFETRACVAWVGSLFLSANKTHKNLLRRYIFFQGFSFYFALIYFLFIYCDLGGWSWIRFFGLYCLVNGWCWTIKFYGVGALYDPFHESILVKCCMIIFSYTRRQQLQLLNTILL